MKKVLVITMLTLVALSAMAAKVYYVNSTNWNSVYAYMWIDGSNNKWPGQPMTLETGLSCNKGDVYSIDCGSYVNIVFNCGSSACQTADLVLNAATPYWYSGVAYASLADIDAIVSAVPDQCPDIMLQGFYWDSYMDKGFGDTKWTTLTSQASEIGQYFSLVWLPPSAKSSGGLGYHPMQYSSQNSDALGSRVELDNLIKALHQNDVKVIADIVINHAWTKSTWCDFYPNNFGFSGTFSPDGSWITKNDEVATSPEAGACQTCSSTSHADDGYGYEANYPAARDWDHLNPEVQAMCRAYLQWMKRTVKYDGWRYDYCKGYHLSHINDYNVASAPYFSVIEYWDGDASTLKKRIDQAGNNTLAFDFAEHYTAFTDGIRVGGNNYSKLKNVGLRGQGYSKYAVTFVDNHDTFNRGSDNEDVGKTRDGSSINNASLILQCNAYILSMPGVPCVFYPHWIKYKEEIKAMAKARWIAGIHSESTLYEEAGYGYYKATIYGKTGEICLLLGPNSGYEYTPAGYTKAYAGNDCGVYYKGTGKWPRSGQPTDCQQPSEIEKANVEKRLINHVIYIRYNDDWYDLMGNKISIINQ